jgi:hypothetical protein
VAKDLATCIVAFEKAHIVILSREYTIDECALYFVFLLLLHFALIYCYYISPVLCFDLATCLTVATKMALLLFNMHTHTRGEGKECAIQGTTIENHIHTHIKGGGRNVVIIERALLLTIVVG